MRRHWSLFVTASRYALIGHARNRFAMLLVVVYIPVWIALAYVTIPDQSAPLRQRATGEVLSPPGNHLTQITGAPATRSHRNGSHGFRRLPPGPATAEGTHGPPTPAEHDPSAERRVPPG